MSHVQRARLQISIGAPCDHLARPGPDLQLLGTIQRLQVIEALAVDRAGQFFACSGALREPLSGKKVAGALRAAGFDIQNFPIKP